MPESHGDYIFGERFNYKEFLPKEMQFVLGNEFPDPQTLPETFSARDTPFWRWLSDFRISTQLDTVNRVKITKAELPEFETDPRLVRKEVENMWNMESRSVLRRLSRGRIRVNNAVLQDVKGGLALEINRHGNILPQLAVIHDHPGPELLSYHDIGSYLRRMKNNKTVFDAVSNDNGFALELPTRGITSEVLEKARIFSIDRDAIHRIYSGAPHYWKWASEQWNLKRYQTDTGGYSVGSDLFDPTANELGLQLISSMVSIQLCEENGIALYFAKPDDPTFRRIRSLEDCFPDLREARL